MRIMKYADEIQKAILISARRPRGQPMMVAFVRDPSRPDVPSRPEQVFPIKTQRMVSAIDFADPLQTYALVNYDFMGGLWTYDGDIFRGLSTRRILVIGADDLESMLGDMTVFAGNIDPEAYFTLGMPGPRRAAYFNTLSSYYTGIFSGDLLTRIIIDKHGAIEGEPTTFIFEPSIEWIRNHITELKRAAVERVILAAACDVLQRIMSYPGQAIDLSIVNCQYTYTLSRSHFSGSLKKTLQLRNRSK